MINYSLLPALSATSHRRCVLGWEINKAEQLICFIVPCSNSKKYPIELEKKTFNTFSNLISIRNRTSSKLSSFLTDRWKEKAQR